MHYVWRLSAWRQCLADDSRRLTRSCVNSSVDPASSRRSEVIEFHAKLSSVLGESRKLVKTCLARSEREALNRLAPFKVIETLEAERERANALFVSAQVPNVQRAALPNPLSKAQAEAVATDEDVTLVLAGAGTGKTGVIVGKVAHLVRNESVLPQEILVLAFNRDAASNVRKRLGGELAQADVATFHSFGRSVIAKAEGRKPTISKLAEDEKRLTKAIDGIVSEILQDPRQSGDLIDFITSLRTPYRSAFEFSTLAEYKEYVGNAELRTLNNDLVKSFEELEIANFLTQNCIEYEYECQYEQDVSTERFSQYRPDFYLRDHKIYIEHFALDEAGRAPKEWRGYVEGVEWKRCIHAKHGTRLVETYSWQRKRGELVARLQATLEEAGVKFQPIPHEDLIEKLKQPVLQSFKLTHLLKTCLHHVKSNGWTRDELRKRVHGNRRRDRLFLNVFEQVHARYEQLLTDEKALDFHDLISRAERHLQDGKWERPYRFVLVDEFQDVSAGRMKLLKSLGRNGSAYFLVGDDWQSIYRFAGSDVGLMLDCGSWLGHVKRQELSRTFRFGEGIGGPSTAFVRRNRAQSQRKLLPKTETAGREEGIGIVVDGDLRHALEEIRSKGRGKDLPVLVLGRYNDSKSTLPCELKRKFSTVHSAKGIEQDYVVGT